jgi:hypothetical protein
MSQDNITLDDLNYFWMPNGAPCFIADNDSIFEIVESIGFGIYYLFSNEQKITTSTATSYKPTTPGAVTSTPTTTTTQTIKNTPKLFKVVSNFVGRSVTISEDPLPDNFVPLEESCEYALPFIPYSMVEKLDQFFRLVHAKHGTESIVLLTFDQTKEGSDGWGILVPSQVNTAAHCHYDAESILDIKPEDAIIVGSVHSHPDMPAYASGTDHADQADFDGIHITFGWQKSVNNGATQYHMELQMSGKNYKLDPEDVFESFTIDKDPDPEVVQWSEQVKKAFPPVQGGHTAHTPATDQTAYQMTNGTADTTLGFRNSFYKENITLLHVEPDAVVIAEVYQQSDGTAVCPSCNFDLDSADFYSGYCQICDIPIALESTSINMIGSAVQKYRKVRNLPTDTNVYLWARDNQGEEFLININMDKALSGTFYEDDDFDKGKIPVNHTGYDDTYPLEDNYDFDPNRLVCCGELAQEYVDRCMCPTTIFYTDFKAFDEETTRVSLYEAGSKCQECLHYWTPQCPGLKSMIGEYIDSGYDSKIIETMVQMSSCDEYVPYESISSDYLYENERYYN